MTKAEKKRVISDLFTEAQKTSDINIIEEKLAKVIQEIYSSGFDLKTLDRVSKIIDTFITSCVESASSIGKDEFILE